MEPYLKTVAATLYHARAEEVYPHLAPGSVSMIWGDGPYALGKGEWDKMGVDGLADWYAPHIEAWGRVCAPSATVYLWNTAEGWARLDPVMRAAGWVFRTLIVWNKVGAHPSRLGAATASKWPDVTEVCGVYGRGTPHHVNPAAASNVWDFDMTNGMRGGERLTSQDTVRRTGGSGRYYECAAPLHPCQKPLAFASRAILASTRSGDVVADFFAGTNRCAVAAQRLPAHERRYVISSEMDARWIEAVRPSLVADYTAVPRGQGALFGAR